MPAAVFRTSPSQRHLPDHHKATNMGVPTVDLHDFELRFDAITAELMQAAETVGFLQARGAGGTRRGLLHAVLGESRAPSS